MTSVTYKLNKKLLRMTHKGTKLLQVKDQKFIAYTHACYFQLIRNLPISYGFLFYESLIELKCIYATPVFTLESTTHDVMAN